MTHLRTIERKSICLWTTLLEYQLGKLIFWVIQIFLVIQLATILIKNLPEDVLKELKRLKVELGCETWADLLSELVAAKEPVILSEEEKSRMKKGVKGFLSLRTEVSRKWKGPPTVLEEIRRSRRHESD